MNSNLASVHEQALKAMMRGPVKVVLKDGSELVGAVSGVYACGLQGAVRLETLSRTIRLRYDDIEQIILPEDLTASPRDRSPRVF